MKTCRTGLLMRDHPGDLVSRHLPHIRDTIILGSQRCHLLQNLRAP